MLVLVLAMVFSVISVLYSLQRLVLAGRAFFSMRIGADLLVTATQNEAVLLGHPCQIATILDRDDLRVSRWRVLWAECWRCPKCPVRVPVWS